jgi:outer membrane receptor protein involved in Fe transport
MLQSRRRAPALAATGSRLALLLISASGAALVAHSAAFAADAGSAPAPNGATGVEEIVVTAERRDETVQKVPMTVQALSGATLSSLNVATFDDVVRYTPNISFSNNGPGQGEIFMRGLSAGGSGSQSSAALGSFPNVAIYLDDQSMQFPGRNADIYMADMARVEVLEGPQGTLFGGGAEAGALRYITNKPKLNTTSANVEAGYGFTDGGAPNENINATFNLPLVTDKLAVRVVLYDERRGGYIDNVPSTFSRTNSDLGNYTLGIKPNNSGLCPNGLAAGAGGYCTVGGAQSINNSSVAGNNQNPTTYEGVRASALYQVNNDWDVLITQSYQSLDAEGVSFEEPTSVNFQPLQPLQVTTFSPAYDKDKFENTSWTVNGKIDGLRIVYTGSYMVRNISQQMDYTNYSRAPYGVYYQCTGGANGFGGGKATCYSPITNWQDTVKNTHLTNEIRISSPDTSRFRFIVGGFLEEFRLYDDMNFNYKTIPSCNAANLAAALAGGPTCLADLAPAAASTVYQPGIRGDNTAFGEDIQRGYDQAALFGSFDYDIIPNVLTVTAGTRYYRYTETETGSVFSSFGGCVDVPNGQCASDTNLNAEHLHAVYSGFRSRANITWHITPDTMVYYTFSQGFRPGGFNRTTVSGAKLGGVNQYVAPLSYGPDSLTNHEIGLKSEFLDHRLQLNLSAYYMIWENVQFGLFNPAAGFNYAFGVNGPSYHDEGVEAQFVGKVAEGLTVQGSGSLNRDRQSSSPCLMDDVAGTAAFGKCITTYTSQGVTQTFPNPFGQVGGVSAFSPTFEGNLRARYEWQVGGYKAHAMVGGNYVGSMYSEPASYVSGQGVTFPTSTLLRYLQPGYATLDASIGAAKDNWHVELYGTNLTDSHASTFTSAAQYIKAETPLRPLVVGLKIGASF